MDLKHKLYHKNIFTQKSFSVPRLMSSSGI